MTMNAPPQSYARAQDLSPNSEGSDSAWSGMNGYNVNNLRPDGPYAAAMPFPRNDSMQPPQLDGQPRMNGLPPGPMFGAPQAQRRRPSEAGSQQSSRAASVANSRSSDGTISDQHSRKYRRMEIELQQHYTVLRSFLRGGAQPQPPRPSKARDKLLRLSPVQFHELSTDVFDELQRRQAAVPLPGREARHKNVPPFLQPIPQFHEKRNQARQKLSSLQTVRFRDLATDVFCELERRFVHFANPEARRRDSSRSVASRAGSARPPLPQVNTSNVPASGQPAFPPRNGSMPGSGPQNDNSPGSVSSAGSEFGRPMPKQFQSNTITPNKSTMVEDDEYDDDGSSIAYGQSQYSDAFGLESVVASPASERNGTPGATTMGIREIKALQDKVAGLQQSLQQKDDEASVLRKELENKVQDAERLNKSLQDELDRIRNQHASTERDLQSQIQNIRKSQEGSGGWKEKHEILRRDHENLQARLHEQQNITEEVSRQGAMFLDEMRAMAENGGGNFEREEKLQSDVHKLEEEVKEWKARFAKAKTQLRGARAKSVGVGITGPDVMRYAKDDTFHAPNGVIKDLHLSQFQIAIDEMLHTAHTAEPTAVLLKMKDVVLAVRSITLDVDSATSDKMDADALQRRMKLRAKVSATANNVITASKSFGAAGGLSPVSLLDAAASHLSAAVVDLVRLVKISPAQPEDDLDEDGFVQIQNTPEPVNNNGYFNMTQRLRSDSAAESEYSALSSPANGMNSTRPTTDTPATSHSINVDASNGLGIKSNVEMGEHAAELQELKVSILESGCKLLR